MVAGMPTAASQVLNYESVPLIQSLLNFFKVENLRMDESLFRQRLQDYLNDRVVVPERTIQVANQNPHLIKFWWGHDHDFGTFQLSGEMGTRHIWMLSRFFDHFDISPAALKDRAVLDVGCWTGGVTLVLNRLGARVTAIDEIRKYPHALAFLGQSFGLESLATEGRSLYELDGPEFCEKFDFIFCLGVVYHLSDPILGLRRLYHALKPSGTLCVESMGINSEECVCEYEGPEKRRGKFGWNWFVPSPRCLFQWLEDSGYREVRVGNGVKDFTVTAEGDPMGPNRCFAVAKKDPDHRISLAGLSAVIA
jgi:2-polyprenyl-3-methyl-5-hydroxy-6-metoxy-1,4-benzoquinol methylase